MNLNRKQPLVLASLWHYCNFAVALAMDISCTRKVSRSDTDTSRNYISSFFKEEFLK